MLNWLKNLTIQKLELVLADKNQLIKPIKEKEKAIIDLSAENAILKEKNQHLTKFNSELQSLANVDNITIKALEDQLSESKKRIVELEMLWDSVDKVKINLLDISANFVEQIQKLDESLDPDYDSNSDPASLGADAEWLDDYLENFTD